MSRLRSKGMKNGIPTSKSLSIGSVSEDVTDGRPDQNATWDSTKSLAIKSLSESLVTEKANHRPDLNTSKSFQMEPLYSLTEVMKKNQSMWNSAKSLATLSPSDDFQKNNRPPLISSMSRTTRSTAESEGKNGGSAPLNVSQSVMTRSAGGESVGGSKSEKQVDRIDSNDSIWSA